ncbi:MAG: hypothetical protein LUC23_02390, partial [Prevotellaceae bacterium]|nr:hypothetical protein [Prevotellaceae bacterium]
MNLSVLCRFQNLRSTTFNSMTWEEFHRELTSDKHKRVTESYRATLRELSALEAKPQPDADYLASCKRLKSEYKTNQPAVVASCTLEGGRKEENVTGYTGVIMVDIDSLPKDLFKDVLQRVKDDPRSLLVHTTLSGMGIRVFSRMEGDVSSTNFNACWKAVNDHYARLAGVKIDESCKNPTRMSVICREPAALFRPDADAFPMPEVKAKKEEKKKAGRPAGTRQSLTPERVESTVYRLLEKEGARYEAGRHNDYIHRALTLMNRLGVDEADATRWALQAFADADAPDNNVAAIARSCYRHSETHGNLALSKCRSMLRSGEQRQKTRVSLHEMEAFLESNCRLRHNLFTHQIEVRLDASFAQKWEYTLTEGQDAACGDTGATGWQRLTDRVENSLWRAMVHEGILCDQHALRSLLTSNFVPPFNPLKSYLDSLPRWDRTTDYIGTLAGMVHCKCCDNATFADYFRRWLVGMVAAALDEKVVNHNILVLLGPQGSFKSSFMENLLPPELRHYYTVKTNSQRLTKDDAFTITENLLVNLEEIDTMTRPEMNQLKALTTVTYINERPAYAHYKVRLPHIASFCATGNNLQFLTDDTGNRRWLAFEVERIDNPWTHPINYAGVYAQAKVLLDDGFEYWIDLAGVEKLNRRNRRFEEENTARNLVLAYYRKPAEGEQGKYLNTAQIMLRFGGGIRMGKSLLVRVGMEVGFQEG